jgi:hypothetical protein
MQKFYFDMSKICFGVGFLGLLAKTNIPEFLLFLAICCLILTIVFAILGSKEKED